MGAVRKGIAIAAINRITDLGETCGAGRCIRRYACPGGVGTAGYDAETVILLRAFFLADLNGVNACQGRDLCPKLLEEDITLVRGGKTYQCPVTIIANLAVKIQIASDSPDSRSKTDTLDDPAYPEECHRKHAGRKIRRLRHLLCRDGR